MSNNYGRGRWNYTGGTGPITDTIDHPAGQQQRLPQPFFKYKTLQAGNGSSPLINIVGLASGQFIFNATQLDFEARSVVIDNPTQYNLLHLETLTQIPAGYVGFPVPIHPTVHLANILVLSGGNIDATLTITARFSEKEVSPAAASGGGSSGSSPSSVGSLSWASPATQSVGTVTPVLIIPARANRWGADVQNLDGSNTLWIGPQNTVAVNTGWPVGPGQDYPLRTQANVYAIAQTASISVATVEIF